MDTGSSGDKMQAQASGVAKKRLTQVRENESELRSAESYVTEVGGTDSLRRESWRGP